MKREIFFLQLVFTAMLLISLLAETVDAARPQGLRSGKDWLSWTPKQRFVFVDTYMAAYTGGKTDACIAAAKLFAPNEKITNVSRQASARCLQNTKSYSRPVEYYTHLITDFYAICPKYEAAPDLYLMTLLSDDQLKTADEFLRKEYVPTSSNSDQQLS